MKKQGLAVSTCGIVTFILIIFAVVLWQKEEVFVPQAFKIGVSTYNSADTFISSIMSNLEQEVDAYEKETGYKIDLDISAAEGNQRTQNNKVKRYIELGYDVVCINLVDHTDTSEIINLALASGTPLLFFNNRPVPEDIDHYENFYYIGVDSYESAMLQSELIIEYWNENRDVVDKNGDGILNYVMLEGEMGHQDSILRARVVIEHLNAHGIETNKLESHIAHWSRSQAYAIIDAWYETHGESIEMIICGNDDMALGAVDALKRIKEEEGVVETIPIVGIDGTAIAIDAIEKGELIGTVDAGATQYAKGILSWAMEHDSREAEENDDKNELEIAREKYISVPMQIIN